MVDIHHHLLWGLDDGAKDLEMAVAMAKLAVADGITHVVCTSHANSEYEYRPEINAARLAELRDRLAAEDVELTLGWGCDFHLSYENVVLAKDNPERFSINGLGYLLVELPDYGMPRNLLEVFFDLQMAKLLPILTHPERNSTLQADEGRLREWIEAGLLIQVTADSVLGKMGRAAEKMAMRLLERRSVDLLASDAHNLSSRPPRMKEAAELVAKRFGEAYAERLVTTNPLAVFKGKQVESNEFLEEPVASAPWWGRLLGR